MVYLTSKQTGGERWASYDDKRPGGNRRRHRNGPIPDPAPVNGVSDPGAGQPPAMIKTPRRCGMRRVH